MSNILSKKWIKKEYPEKLFLIKMKNTKIRNTDIWFVNTGIHKLFIKTMQWSYNHFKLFVWWHMHCVCCRNHKCSRRWYIARKHCMWWFVYIQTSYVLYLPALIFFSLCVFGLSWRGTQLFVVLVTYCSANQYVSSHVCTTCAAGTTNVADDSAAGPNTACDGTLTFLRFTIFLSDCVESHFRYDTPTLHTIVCGFSDALRYRSVRIQSYMYRMRCWYYERRQRRCFRRRYCVWRYVYSNMRLCI